MLSNGELLYAYFYTSNSILIFFLGVLNSERNFLALVNFEV